MAHAKTPGFAVGDVVAIPLPNGSYGAICIVDVPEGFRCCSFFVVDPFWKRPPVASDVAKPRPMSHPSGELERDNVWKGWFQGRVPKDFLVVTRVKLTAAQKRYAEASGTMVFQNAEHFRRELFQHWRWVHDRAALQAEWAAHTAKYEAEQAARAAKRKASNSLPKMLREKPFAHWRAHWGMRPVRAVQGAFETATKELIKVGAKGPKAKREQVFARLMTALNDLDDKFGCIETGEREELVARIEELAGLVGLSNADERLTGTRDW